MCAKEYIEVKLDSLLMLSSQCSVIYAMNISLQHVSEKYSLEKFLGLSHVSV